METKTIKVNFPGNSIQDIEIAVYKKSLITLYNDKIYQGGKYENEIYFSHNVNKMKNGLIINHPSTDYLSDIFLLTAATANGLIEIKLMHNSDENDKIGSFIRANELFGTSNEYIIK